MDGTTRGTIQAQQQRAIRKLWRGQVAEKQTAKKPQAMEPREIVAGHGGRGQ